MEIEKFIAHTPFEFVSCEKLGEGQIIDVKNVCVEEDALKEVTIDRKKEIVELVYRIK